MKTKMQKENDVNRKKQTEMRAKYMDHKISHEEYYAWLADFIGATKRIVPASKEELLSSTDPHLNDIELRRWDAQEYITRSMAGRMGLTSWSLSDNVCVLKELARRIIKEEEVKAK